MVTTDLTDFIKAQRDARVPIEEISRMLVTEGGWDENDVAEALRVLGIASSGERPPQPTSPTSSRESTATPHVEPSAPPSSPVSPPPPVTESKVGSIASNVTPQYIPPPSPDPAEHISVKPALAAQIRGSEPPRSAAPMATQRSQFFPPESVVKAVTEPHSTLATVLSAVVSEPTAPFAERHDQASPPSQPLPPVEKFAFVEATASPFSFAPATPAPTYVDPTRAGDDFLGIFGPPSAPLPGAISPESAHTGGGVSGTGKSAAEWSRQYLVSHGKDIPVDAPKIPHSADDPVFDVPLDSSPPRDPYEHEDHRDARAPSLPVFSPTPSAVDRLNMPGEAQSTVAQKTVSSSSVADLWLSQAAKTPPPPPAPVLPVPAQFTTPTFDPDRVTVDPLVHSKKLSFMGGGTMKWVWIAAGIIAFLFVVGAGLFAYITMRAPDPTVSLGSAVINAFSSPSLSYKGKADTDLTFYDVDTANEAGNATFSFTYEGKTALSEKGFGDGEHRITLNGGFRYGGLVWKTDLDARILIIGTSLYFRALIPPSATGIDPDILKSYWVKVDMSALAKELGLVSSLYDDAYGAFGSSRGGATIPEMLTTGLPLVVTEKLPDEVLNGKKAYRYSLAVDPKKGEEFVLMVAKSVLGRDIAFTEDDRVRFLALLEKISGEAWVDKGTGELVRFTLSARVDDIVRGVRVKGPLSFAIDPTPSAGTISPDLPTPVLTLEELRFQMEEYRAESEKRAEDAARIEDMRTITTALGEYYSKKGRYPTLLTDLSQEGLLPDSVSSDELIRYVYYGYRSADSFTRTNRCTAKSKSCPAYHIGVNLHDVNNPALSSDVDRVGDIVGDDAVGCGREVDFACYDTTSDKPAARILPSSLPTGAQNSGLAS